MFYHLTMRRLIANARTVFPIALLGCFTLHQGAYAQTPDEGTALETVIVTASRTPDTAFTLPVAWSALDDSTIERIAAQHSNQVFNRVAGAWISRGNGQESLISLRSPVLTGAGSCGVGFSGVMIIMWARLTQGVDVLGLLLCIIGAIALTIATLTLKDASSGGNIMMIVGLQMLVGSSVLAVFCILFEDVHFSLNSSFIFAFAYTTVFPGLVATVVWFKLVNEIGAVKAATYHFLNPFFGVLIAWLFLSESISYMDGLGVIIITIGIYLVQTSKRQTL